MSAILYPIKWVVAWIMVLVHDFAVFLGMPQGPGWAWIISIVGLTVVIRILLIPLFFRQIKASRGMQMVQPELQKLQARYKGKRDPASQQKMQEEMMALYKEAGTTPFASCLPLLLQMPIFFALFSVLNDLDNIAAGTAEPIGPLTQQLAADAENSELFGAPISATFMQTFGESAASLAGQIAEVRVVTLILIVLMSVTTFFTQRQLTMKNMPQATLESPMMRTQMIMLYILPVVFAVSGVNFPIGVLIYWFVSNVWSMGQQFYTIRSQPAPGSEAYRVALERMNKRRAKKGLDEATHLPHNQPKPTVRKDAPAATVIEEATPLGDDVGTTPPEEVRGKDGLTASERAQRRYERRAAERRAAQEKRRRKGS